MQLNKKHKLKLNLFSNLTTLSKTNKMITFNNIEQIICDGEKVSSEALNCKNRHRELVQARQLIFYFTRRYTKESLQRIANRYHMDHATILHACKVIQNYLDTEQYFRDKIRDYECQIVELINNDSQAISQKRDEVIAMLKTSLENGKPINHEAVIVYNRLIQR